MGEQLEDPITTGHIRRADRRTEDPDETQRTQAGREEFDRLVQEYGTYEISKEITTRLFHARIKGLSVEKLPPSLNEDSIYAEEILDEYGNVIGLEIGLFDGLGGEAQGKSMDATPRTVRDFQNAMIARAKSGKVKAKGDIQELQSAFREDILGFQNSRPNTFTGKTTYVGYRIFTNGNIVMAHIGDSRGFVVDNERVIEPIRPVGLVKLTPTQQTIIKEISALTSESHTTNGIEQIRTQKKFSEEDITVVEKYLSSRGFTPMNGALGYRESPLLPERITTAGITIENLPKTLKFNLLSDGIYETFLDDDLDQDMIKGNNPNEFIQKANNAGYPLSKIDDRSYLTAEVTWNAEDTIQTVLASRGATHLGALQPSLPIKRTAQAQKPPEDNGQSSTS